MCFQYRSFGPLTTKMCMHTKMTTQQAKVQKRPTKPDLISHTWTIIGPQLTLLTIIFEFTTQIFSSMYWFETYAAGFVAKIQHSGKHKWHRESYYAYPVRLMFLAGNKTNMLNINSTSWHHPSPSETKVSTLRWPILL